MLSYNKICGFDDLYVIEPKKYNDNRGYFQETFNKDEFKKYTNIEFNPVQENESSSKYGVVRGLHFQTDIYQQAKIVKCLNGAIIDVAFDMREKSPSYGKLFSTILSKKNNKQLFIPKGVAHGFIAIGENTDNVIRYLTDNHYMPAFDSGILFEDDFIKMALSSEITDEFTTKMADYLSNKDNLLFSDKDLALQHWEKIKR